MNVLMKIFSVFISKKLMKRMKFYKKEWHAVAEHLGSACIPKGFGECNGTLTANPIIDQYLVMEGAKEVSIS